MFLCLRSNSENMVGWDHNQKLSICSCGNWEEEIHGSSRSLKAKLLSTKVKFMFKPSSPALILPLEGERILTNLRISLSFFLLTVRLLYIMAKLTKPCRKRGFFCAPLQTGIWSSYPGNPCLSALQIRLAVIWKGSFVRAVWNVWFLICFKYFPCWWQHLSSKHQGLIRSICCQQM